MSRTIKLVIGDKNLSSWSMRAWLAAKASEIPFEEILVRLDTPDTKSKLQKYSPSQRVPCLIDGDLRIWDSLAIAEYLAEMAPDKELWPKHAAKRALARSMTAEMHSGFAALRNQLSMDLRLSIQVRHLTADTISDIRRVVDLWSNAVKVSDGPYLFGRFGIVDAFYAPVVFRFMSYGIEVKSPECQRYMSAIRENRIVKEWFDAGIKEEPIPCTF